MAQIMKIEEFVKVYGDKMNEFHMAKLLGMKPGENDVLGFSSARCEDIVFVRVTKHHMATMSVYEFNGIR